jgi:8-oxo-dGTP diphosphatase
LHVAVALFDSQHRVLLVRQGYGQQLWSLPGGAVEPHESPLVAAVRETNEETGLGIVITGLVGVYAAPERDMLSMLFKGEIASIGDWQPSDEITEVRYVAADALPDPMSVRMRQRITETVTGRCGVYRDGSVELHCAADPSG